MNFSSRLPQFQRILKQPRRLVTIIALLWMVWVAWNTWQVMADRPVTEADVSARRIQVNRQLYQSIQTRLKIYHQPQSSPELTTGFFRTIAEQTR